jgi:hypothetical protein
LADEKLNKVVHLCNQVSFIATPGFNMNESFLFVFLEAGSHCVDQGWPQTHNSPASTALPQVLGLQAFNTMPGKLNIFVVAVAVRGIEPRSLGMLGKPFTTGLHPQSHG